METITPPLSSLLRRLWRHISPRRRSQLGMLLVLMVLASFAEIVSIGAVLPFLGALTSPAHVFAHPAAQSFVGMLGVKTPQELLLPLTVLFALATLGAGGMRLLLLWANTRLSFAVGADLSSSIYRRTLYQPYWVHVSRNSSEVINGIASKTQSVIYNIVMPALTLLSSALMLLVILLGLLWVNPIVAATAVTGFGLIYLLVIMGTRHRLLRDGRLIARESTQVIKVLQEGLGGIRDVLIDGTQETYYQAYRQADLPLRRAQGRSQFISQSPRFVMEALGMLLITFLAYVLAQQSNGLAKAIPVLGVLAMGAQRLLPLLQQGYGAWTVMQSTRPSLQDALVLLEQPLPETADQPLPRPMPFAHALNLKSLSFRYGPEMPWILKNIDLTIHKGERIGFIGVTGSGKSTLLDLVMCLLEPTEGRLEVDGAPVSAGNRRSWQAHIAHVPQSIFLADTSIEENIAFGVPKAEIDVQRLRDAARQAQISEMIETWPQQYRTRVGERGIRLSGGQRQRIGIARALYKRADVIIFDEATSALDGETETAVMQAIEGLSENLTVLIIAHRLTTLKGCTRVVELGGGQVKRIGAYRDVVR